MGILTGQTIKAQTRQEGKFVSSVGTTGSMGDGSQIQHSKKQFKYQEDDGYMRGARIADKI
jgi:hypothetical protein